MSVRWLLSLALLAGCDAVLRLSKVQDRVPDAAVTCPPEYTLAYVTSSNETSYYRFEPTGTDFYSAAADCADDETSGAPIFGHTHLPVLSDLGEAQLLYQTNHVWLGLTELEDMQTWRWVTHEPLPLDPSANNRMLWSDGEPSATPADEYCAHFDGNHPDLVNNVVCDTTEHHAYYCECDAYPNDPATYGM